MKSIKELTAESTTQTLERVGVLEDNVEQLNQNIAFPDGVGFYPDIQDGVRGYNTDQERGADTFVPFKQGVEITGAYNSTLQSWRTSMGNSYSAKKSITISEDGVYCATMILLQGYEVGKITAWDLSTTGKLLCRVGNRTSSNSTPNTIHKETIVFEAVSGQTLTMSMTCGDTAQRYYMDYCRIG